MKIRTNTQQIRCEFFALIKIIHSKGKDRVGSRAVLWLRSYLLVPYLLLFLHSFAQAHLEVRPFRLADTDLSGGDHICDLRRDSNGDGRPDRLGDYLRTSGTVIAKPATFDSDGWLFWIRQGDCGIMVYGEVEDYRLGDSIIVEGQLRITNGGYFFPETGMATLGDLAIENQGTLRIASNCWHDPIDVEPQDLLSDPQRFAGNLVRLSGLVPARIVRDEDSNSYAWLDHQQDSIPIYLDFDTGCSIDSSFECLEVIGIVVRMKVPEIFADLPQWCVAPRKQADIKPCQSSEIQQTTWGRLKAEFNRGIP